MLEKLKEDLRVSTVKVQKVATKESDYNEPLVMIPKPIHLPKITVPNDLFRDNDDVLYVNKLIVRNFALLGPLSVLKWVAQFNAIFVEYLKNKYQGYINVEEIENYKVLVEGGSLVQQGCSSLGRILRPGRFDLKFSQAGPFRSQIF